MLIENRPYKDKQQLSKITEEASGEDVLNYAPHFQDIFSKGFIAVPDKDDIIEFRNKKKISWNTDEDIIDEIKELQEICLSKIDDLKI